MKALTFDQLMKGFKDFYKCIYCGRLAQYHGTEIHGETSFKRWKNGCSHARTNEDCMRKLE